MRQLGTIIAIALIIGAGSALAVVQDGPGGAAANSSNSPAQQCRDEGIEPGNGNAFGKCVSEDASAFGKCVSDAARRGAGNPTETCADLKPGNGDEDVDGNRSANSPAQQCRDEAIEPGNGNAFGECVSEEASAFGKCVSDAAGPGAGNPTGACEPSNGNGASGEGPPAELSVPPEPSEQVSEYAAAPESDTGENAAPPESDTGGNGTGGVAVPSK